VVDCETRLFIGGKFRDSSDGRRFPVIDPATGDSLADVADATVEDGLEAVDAAAAALGAWGARPPRERAEILRKAFDLLIEQEDRFARLMTLENGKPLADSRAELRYGAEFFRWFSEEAVRNLGTVSIAPASGARSIVMHRPAGVAVMVTPWNFPLAMGTRKIAPALAAGCSCVLKPASDTPLTMLALAELLATAGVPDGVVNILPSSRTGAVVDAMLHHPAVRVLSFTGSTEVGRSLLKSAADQVLTAHMELGGNAPFLVFDDADLDAAVAGALIAKMRNMGEACTAANRFYVQDGIFEAFTDRLSDAMAALKVGNGLEEGVKVGPLVDRKALEKVERLVGDAVDRGAHVRTGGARVGDKGLFYSPTVLSDVPPDAACLSEEIFGPVAPIVRFSDDEEAIRLANGTEFGLTAYVYTGDLRRGLAVCERLEVGMVGLNRGIVSDPSAPFGGRKQSGLGREGAHEGLKEYLETQYISTEW